MTAKTKALIKLERIVASCQTREHYQVAYTYYHICVKRFGISDFGEIQMKILHELKPEGD